MKELETLKELYLDEIKKITKKGELTPADSEAARKALESIAMINDICDKQSWSERSYERRGRSSSTGRYISRSDGAVNRMISKLEGMRYEAPDLETKMAIDNVISKLETY